MRTLADIKIRLRTTAFELLPEMTFVTVATLADQDNCFAFNPAADKQQVARLQQALDKVRQGEAFKQLIARYQDVVQPPPADHLPRIE